MPIQSPETPAQLDRAATTVTIVGSLGHDLGSAMKRMTKRRLAADVRWFDHVDGIVESANVVVVADLPDRARQSLVGGAPAEYQARLETLLERISTGDGRLVIWLTVPHQAYGEAAPWSATAVRQLNKGMKRFCAHRGIHLIAMAAKLERWGADSLLTNGLAPTLNGRGVNAIAPEVAQVVEQWALRTALSSAPCPDLDPGRFPDLAALYRDRPEEADRLVIDRMVVRDAPFVAYGPKCELTPDNRLHLNRWEPVQLDDPVRWNMRGPDRSWESGFLALEFIPALLRHHKKDGRPEWLERALDLILSWRDANPPTAPVAPRAWHEGTTTRRTNSLALTAHALLQAFQAPGGTDLYASLNRPGCLVELLALLEQHVTFLLNPDIYIHEGNHGVRQDTFILFVAAAFPDFRDAEAWRDAVCRRLERHQLNALSGDGVWLEHSPGYHYMVTRRFLTILRLLEYGGHTAMTKRLRAVLDRMVTFGLYALRPDGRQPALGDTLESRCRVMRRASFYEQLPVGGHALYSGTQGKSGVIPPHVDAVFPDGGWAILRDAWHDAERFGETVYVNFHANLHSAKHKHADDLSFILYGKGRDWIVDSGRLNNEIDDPMKDHFRLDAAAHNTYTVDGRSYRFQRKSVRQVGILRSHSADKGAVVVGVNRLYEGASVVRTLVFLRHEAMIVLIDELVSNRGPRHWASHLHLAPDLEVDATGETAWSALCPSSEWVMDVVTSEPALDRAEIVRGRDEPLLGWVTAGWNQAVEAPVLVHHRHGDVLTAVTSLRLRRVDEEPLRSVGLAARKRGKYRVEAVVGDRRWNLEVRTGRRPKFSWS